MPRRPPNPGNPDQSRGARTWVIETSDDGRLWQRYGRPHASLRNACQAWRYGRTAWRTHPPKARFWNVLTGETRLYE